MPEKSALKLTNIFQDINFTDFIIFTDMIIHAKASSVQVMSVIVMSDNIFGFSNITMLLQNFLDMPTEPRKTEKIDVAKEIIAPLNNTEELRKLQSAHEDIKGILLDNAKVHSTSNLFEGVPKKNAKSLISLHIKSQEIPKKEAAELKEELFTRKSTQQSSEVNYVTGKGDSSISFVYMKVASVTYNEDKIKKMDMAFAFLEVKFDLSNVEVHIKEDKKIWFIKIGTKTVTKFEPKKLTVKDQDDFANYMRYEAMENFKYDNPPDSDDDVESD